MVWISIGGPVFGYIMAKVAIFWLQWTFNDTLTEIAITLSVAYLVFYIGQLEFISHYINIFGDS